MKKVAIRRRLKAKQQRLTKKQAARISLYANVAAVLALLLPVAIALAFSIIFTGVK